MSPRGIGARVPISPANPTTARQTPRVMPRNILLRPVQTPPMVNVKGDRPEPPPEAA